MVNFTMPILVVGAYSLEIYRSNNGLAAGGPLKIMNEFLVQSIEPIEGSRGLAEITVIGSGFKNNSIVYLGGYKLNTISNEPNKIIAYLPKYDNLVDNKQYEVQVNMDDSLTPVKKTCQTCKYTAKDAYTPKIISHNGVTVNLTTNTFEVSVTGTGFDMSEKIAVFCYLTINDFIEKGNNIDYKIVGTIKNKSSTNVNITFSNIPAGNYHIRLNFEGKGFAMSNRKYSMMLVYPKSGTISPSLKASYAGGSVLTITGGGFFSDSKYMKHSNEITICGLKCMPISSTYSEVTCKAPLMLTSNSLAKYNLITEKKLEFKVEVIGAKQKIKYLTDGKTSTYYNYRNADCSILLDFGENMEIKITKINFFLAMRFKTSLFYKSFFEASTDKINWELLFKPDFLITSWNRWASPLKFENKRYR